MSDDIKPLACPACGDGTDGVLCHTAPDGFGAVRWFVQCSEVDCWMTGPVKLSEGLGLAAWNALPRWPDWRPVGEPPDRPAVGSILYVLGWLKGVGCYRCFYCCDGSWMPEGVTHWTHLPPGPKEPQP